MNVVTEAGEMEEQLLQVILDEVNVKSATVEKGAELSVTLDLELTPELLREGMVREVSRKVNSLRKQAGLSIEDRIDLKIWSADSEVKKMFEEHEGALKENTLATSVSFDKDDSLDQSEEFRVHEQDFWIGF